jgi:putative polyketide hydroxylase
MTRVNLSRKYQVLVVGAGPGGLVASITLARYGIDVLVIDKRTRVSGLSRSLVISTRGMELMRRFGLEDPIRSGAADVKIRAWVTPNLSSREGTELPSGYPTDAEAAQASPTRPAWVAQDHHEPILVDHLRGLSSATIRFGCRLQEVTQHEHGVRATLIDGESRALEHVHASFLIAADGAHSTVRTQLGIDMAGPDDLADYQRVEFTAAPLWHLVGEHRYGLYVITSPDAAGALAPRGLGDRWFLAQETPVGSRGMLDLTDDRLTEVIRRAVGSDTLRPQIERVSSWAFAAQLAERYRSGHCFLVGDAAHRMTPRGGMGMNTAIQDAFDLGWKMAWVLRGWAGPQLLDSYERERRPVAAHNVQRSAQPGGARSEVGEALPWDLNGRLPHHWVTVGDKSQSTVDLIGDGLTLLVGHPEAGWGNAARYAERNAPIDVHSLDGRVLDALDLPEPGALLTRPDGHVLRRWSEFDDAARADLQGANLGALLTSPQRGSPESVAGAS